MGRFSKNVGLTLSGSCLAEFGPCPFQRPAHPAADTTHTNTRTHPITRITVLRVDQETQVVTVDENTSFRDRTGQSATLADIKPGDRIMARGGASWGW